VLSRPLRVGKFDPFVSFVNRFESKHHSARGRQGSTRSLKSPILRRQGPQGLFRSSRSPQASESLSVGKFEVLASFLRRQARNSQALRSCSIFFRPHAHV
jgi:hypothetical protein